MKPVWSFSFWSLMESRISKIKVIGFMGQSCHSESSGYLSNHATFMDHKSDIRCNEKLYSYNIARGRNHCPMRPSTYCNNASTARTRGTTARQGNSTSKASAATSRGLDRSDRGPSYRCRVQRRASVVFVLGESWEYWLATITSWHGGRKCHHSLYSQKDALRSSYFNSN